MSKPALLMLLTRHPYAENSGRATMLRQRISQARLRFEPHIVVFGAPAGDARDEGLRFLPLAKPLSVLLNASRMPALPLQTWLYHSRAARAEVARLAAETSAAGVYVDMLRLVPLAADLPPHVARIVDYDDLLSLRYARAASQDYDVMGFLAQRVGPLARLARAFARPLLAAESARCARYERDVLHGSDLVLFTSPQEAGAVQGENVLAAPPLIAAHDNPPAPGERLIFLGNMRYAENVVMLRALAEAVRESEGALAPDVVIEVAGDHAPELAREFDARRFRFLGRVEDLSVLAGAGVFLAPVIGGSGVKLKVLDGMALGCPVVGTEKACEGLTARRNRHLLVAGDAAGVLRAAVQLRSRAALKAMLAQRARAYLQRTHAPAIGEAIAEAMLAATARAAERRQETL
ncbi:MAG TPA: glycosyltransferase [Vitreimonas sp.]|uniref:glycosyltransferase n=1 Tax=Vitreimonas sp. TaxID=3069702 RepID=UPI002D3AA825|nr:glycosyltransferase [Vitreimonas sp.]HYD88951.1 glycosyltransferase [Vitreimonas sp.]